MIKFFMITAILQSAHATGIFFKTQPNASNIQQGCISLANQGVFNCTMSFGKDWGFGNTLKTMENACLIEAMTDVFKSNVTIDMDMIQEHVEGTIYNDDLERIPTMATAGRSILEAMTSVQTGSPFHLSFLNYKIHLTTCITDFVNCKEIALSKNFVYNSTGSGVKIFVFGEGVRSTHMDFVSLNTGSSRVNTSVNFTELVDNDCSTWQGTHVAALAAGVVHGIAKEAAVVSVAVKPGCRVRGMASDMIKGIKWISDHLRLNPGPAVVLVSALVRHRVPEGLAISIFESMVRDLSKNAVIVSSAGSLATDACLFSPASMPEVITVAAAELVQLQSRPAAIPWDSSNFGKCVNIWGPGVRIESAISTSDDDTALYSGTAQAAAIVSGVCAQIMGSSPDMNTSSVKLHLLKDAAYTVMMSNKPDTPLAFVQSETS